MIAVCLHLCTFYPEWIEYSYSRNLYAGLSGFLRDVLGALPFSIGDLIYGYWTILVAVVVFDFIRSLVRRSFDRSEFLFLSIRNIRLLVGVYIFFQLFWGFNYSRLGVADQFKISASTYDTDTLLQLNNRLVKKVNVFEDDYFSELNYVGDDEVFTIAGAAINDFAVEQGLPNYSNPSVKKSLYGKAASYLGISGYFNPFTGEAQVNTNVPKVLLPVVSCHEIAHQLGYGSESEASFIAFLSAAHSKNRMLCYSAYFDMFLYANYELSKRDSIQSRKIFSQLSDRSKENYELLVAYHRNYENAVEPFFKSLYGQFLKMNHQEKGIQSYNEVVAWLISYYRKEKQI